MSRTATDGENGLQQAGNTGLDAPITLTGLADSSEGANRITVYSNTSPTKSIRMLHAEGDEGDLSLLQEHMMKQSRTIDDFTRIIADWRSEREQRQRSGDGAIVRTSVYGENAAGSNNMSHSGNSLRVRSSTLSLRSKDGDAETASQYSFDDQDDASPSISPAASTSLGINGDTSGSNVKVRCTCCCGKGTRKCKRARRATREWGEVESDLRLAAEIGQALLRKNDGLQNELNQAQQDYSTRIDSLMKKLSSSIKEAGHLEKQREQSELNLEATEASNRSLVRELDETRKEVIRFRSVNAKSSSIESKLERALRDAADAKQELSEEKKVVKKLEKAQRELSEQLKIACIESSSRGTTSEEDRAKRRQELEAVAEAKISTSSVGIRSDDGYAKALAEEVDQLQEEMSQLKEMLDCKNDEIAQLRERVTDEPNEDTLDNRSHRKASGTLSSELFEDCGKEEGSSINKSMSRSPSQSGKSDALSGPNTPQLPLKSIDIQGNDDDKEIKQGPSFLTSEPTSKNHKETRTAQLLALIESVQRIFSRLSSADVDTLSKRLQRQKLTGDVGHLARTTVNGILRDVEALREQFRKAMEMESRSRDVDTLSQKSGKSEKESESLIAKKEFFALIKVFRELLVEIIRLRRSINEVSLQPQHAARILQEQLGMNMNEDKGMGAWIGRLFTAVPSQGITVASTQSQTMPTTVSGRMTARTPSGGQMTSRAIAAVVPSTVAVEVKGTHASEQSPYNFNLAPSHARQVQPNRQKSLSRMQSRNLSGLFVGSLSAGSDGGNTFNYAQSGNIHSRIVSEQGSNRYNRLSRIVDDDEVSIHQGFTPKRGLRPRNLSDSSIRTTYMEDEDRSRQPTHTAISRIITPSSLSLQASSLANAGVVHSYTSASLLSDDDSASTISKGTSSSMREVSSNTGFLSAIAPRATVSKALNFFAGPSLSPIPNQPSLRSTSSSAKLSLAAASAKNEIKVQSRKDKEDDDAFQVGSSRAREMGF